MPRPGTSSPRGASPSIWLTALPLGDGPAADEPLGHALAALDAQWVFLAAKAVAGHEERLRRFAGVLRALPAWPAVPSDARADPTPRPFGVAVRRMSDDAQTFLEIANDSPYPIRLAELLDAPGFGSHRGPRPRPSPLAGSRGRRAQPGSRPAPLRRRGDPDRSAARSALVGDAVSVRGRADHHASAIQRAVGPAGAAQSRAFDGVALEPANPGFEPDSDSSPRRPAGSSRGTGCRSRLPHAGASTAVPGGWRVEGKPAGTSTIAIDRENPHCGQGSLQLTAAVGSGVGGQRAIRAERPIQPR